MAFSDTIDTSLPAGTDDPSEADDNMRRIQGGFQELGNVEHDYSLTGTEITGTGKHTDITADSIAINTDKFTVDNDGNVAVNTDKFTVDADGNVAVAGTLNVIGVATVGSLADGSVLEAATEVGDGDRTIVDKGFLSAGVPTTVDSTSAAMLRNHAYRTQTAGFVTAYTKADSNASLQGFVDTDSNPASGGIKVGQSRVNPPAGTTQIPFISFFVGFETTTGIFFEIVCDDALTITWTPLLTGGGAPIDQD